MTEAIVSDRFPAVEVMRLQQEARARALSEAVHLEHELSAPVVPDRVTTCPHFGRMDECDCPRPGPAEYEGIMRLIEESTVERVMRNAERFYTWIFHGETPALMRDVELLEMQGDGADDPG